MAWTFNPFTGSFDQKGSGGGGGASYIDGEVATYNDLPLDGTAALNSAWLVRGNSGIWPFNKPAGIYYRSATAGVSRDADYTYGGTLGDVFADNVFLLYDNSDSTRNLQFDLGEISTGTTRTVKTPDRSGRMDMSDYRVLTTTATAVAGDKIAADTTSAAWTLTLPATPANGDTITVLDYARTFDTNNLTIARNGSNIESLAENMVCETEDAAFSLVYVGSTVGWKVVPFQGTAIPSVRSDATGITGAAAITNIVTISQANYDALGTYDATTVYVITDPS